VPSGRPLGLAVLITGVLLFGIALWLVWDSYDGSKWSTTNGTVLSSDVSISLSFDKSWFHYRPVVTFEYLVEGKTYKAVATAAAWNHRRESLVSATGAAMDYEKGSTVKVFYRQGNPGRAALKLESQDWHIWLLTIGVFAAIAGVTMLRRGRADTAADGDG
jgi:hypothetical protein